mgnify:CR=1 FL=1
MAKMEPKKLAECLDYFRQRPVYEKLFLKFREKYTSLGHMGGKSGSVRAYLGRKAAVRWISAKGLHREQNCDGFRRTPGKTPW